MLKDFLYYLLDKDGKSYFVNNGTVATTNAPTPLNVTPDGWSEATIKWTRISKYSGMLRTYTTPLKFVKDAALILRKRFYMFGTEDKVFLLIQMLDKAFGEGWKHKFFYRGELDLTQVVDEDVSVTANIMEGDLSKLLNANESTKYEIEPQGPYVELDGVDLYQKANFQFLWNFEVERNLFSQFWLAPLIHGIDEGFSPGIIFLNQDVAGTTPPDPGDPYDTNFEDNYFAAAYPSNPAPVTIRVKGKVHFNITAPGSPANLRMRFIRSAQTQANQNDYEVFVTPLANNAEYSYDFDYTFALAPDERLHIQFVWLNGSGSEVVQFFDDSKFFVEYINRAAKTYVKAATPMQVGQALIDKICGPGYTFASNYISGYWDNLLIISGDGIRGLGGAKIKTSFTDFFNSYNVVCNLALFIEGQTLRLEEKGKAYGATIVLDLGAGKGMSVKTAKEHQYATVKIGYPNPESNDVNSVNGKDEFNTTYVYTSPITRVNKELELVSIYKASMYEIELLRINTEGKVTSDTNTDNDIFFLHVQKKPVTDIGNVPPIYHRLLRNTYSSVSGLFSPSTAFNIELHPELCLKRHGNYLRSVFYWQDAGYLDFQTADKNSSVVVIKSGVTYIGNKHILIGSLAAPLFIPLTFEFESAIPKDITDIMENTPTESFQFEYDGQIIVGFPQEVSIQPASNAAQQTTLLCSPVTNILKLIDSGR